MSQSRLEDHIPSPDEQKGRLKRMSCGLEHGGPGPVPSFKEQRTETETTVGYWNTRVGYLAVSY